METYKLLVWDESWADEFSTFGFDIVPEDEYLKTYNALKSADDDLIEELENNEFYFGTNEFHTFSYDTILHVFKRAATVNEREFDVLTTFFGDAEGICFYDDIVSIINRDDDEDN